MRSELEMFYCYSCYRGFKHNTNEYPYCVCCGSGRVAYETDEGWISLVTGEVVDIIEN